MKVIEVESLVPIPYEVNIPMTLKINVPNDWYGDRWGLYVGHQIANTLYSAFEVDQLEDRAKQLAILIQQDILIKKYAKTEQNELVINYFVPYQLKQKACHIYIKDTYQNEKLQKKYKIQSELTFSFQNNFYRKITISSELSCSYIPSLYRMIEGLMERKETLLKQIPGLCLSEKKIQLVGYDEIGRSKMFRFFTLDELFSLLIGIQIKECIPIT